MFLVSKGSFVRRESELPPRQFEAWERPSAFV